MPIKPYNHKQNTKPAFLTMSPIRLRYPIDEVNMLIVVARRQIIHNYLTGITFAQNIILKRIIIQLIYLVLKSRGCSCK